MPTAVISKNNLIFTNTSNLTSWVLIKHFVKRASPVGIVSVPDPGKNTYEVFYDSTNINSTTFDLFIAD